MVPCGTRPGWKIHTCSYSGREACAIAVNTVLGSSLYYERESRDTTVADSPHTQANQAAIASRDIPNLTHRGLVARYLEFHHNWTRMAGAI